jgi:hypothetical protein
MRKTDCFVKVTISLADHDLELILRGIPIFYTTGNVQRISDTPLWFMKSLLQFRSERGALLSSKETWGCFAKGLQSTTFSHEYNAFHNLTLVDPYESQPLPGAPKFLSRKLQDSLLAPYRKLRGFPLFTIKGAVEKDLSRDAVSDITSTRIGTDPELYLAELAELKSKGNGFFRAGANELAASAYQQGLVKILSIGSTADGGTAKGGHLQEIGGPDFCDRVSALLFDMNSNAARTMLKMSRIHYTEIPLDTQGYMEYRFYPLIDACHIARFLGSTWMPLPRCIRKVFYREAAGSRIVGDLERASNAINSAIDNIPNDVEL